MRSLSQLDVSLLLRLGWSTPLRSATKRRPSTRFPDLSMIDMSDRTNVDMRLVPLEDSRIAPRRVQVLLQASCTQSVLYGTAGRRPQGPRSAKERPSERHDHWAHRKRRSGAGDEVEVGMKGEVLCRTDRGCLDGNARDGQICGARRRNWWDERVNFCRRAFTPTRSRYAFPLRR